MNDKATLGERVKALRINPDAIQEVRVKGFLGEPGREEDYVIPNAEGKRASLQIYASITTPDGFITPDGAREGLAVFGDELRAESASGLGNSHPSVHNLEIIARGGKPVRVDVVRKPEIKMHPFKDEVLVEAAKRFGTPVIVYHEGFIRDRISRLANAFAWVPGGFMNHIAVKATDCAPIIKMAYDSGMGLDCASPKELHLAERLGITGGRVILTSNATPASLFRQARDMGAIPNLDDESHVAYYLRKVGALPKLVYLRQNPAGFMTGGNRIIGEPDKQKYGIMRSQMVRTLRALEAAGVEEFGLHQMIVSNELREENLIGAARSLMQWGEDLSGETTMRLHGLNFGGGLGHAYRPEQIDVDEKIVAEGIRAAYGEILAKGKNANVQLKMENGRWLTAGAGVLLMDALHLEHKPGGTYVKVDASGNDFARVEAYGCYQHLVVPGKTGNDWLYNVAGPKCENSDHWAINRLLPRVEEGDVLGLCGAGAHGHMMGSDYNGFPTCGEVMVMEDGSMQRLTRTNSLRDQFAKYDFPNSKFAFLVSD